MFIRTLASLAAIATSVSAANPVAALAGNPVFTSTTNTDAFSMNTRVAIKNAPTADGEEGIADFNIRVTVNVKKNGKPHRFEVRAACENEVFLLEDGALLFDPYPTDPEIGTCTRSFIDQMNAGFGASVVGSPISLAVADSGRNLIFNFNGAQIPLARS